MPLHHPSQNHLLAVLPLQELERLRPHLELVPMPLGWVVHESGHPHDYVYFPTSSVISLLYVMQNGASAKIAIVGNDGLVGMASFMGGDTTTSRAVVQSSGYGYRLPAAAIQLEFKSGSALRPLVLRHTQALIVQMTQTAVCHRHHTMEQQLCRWLLLSADRLNSREMALSLDLMVAILGADQLRIVQAVACLQARGLIRFQRGTITLVDRQRLEAFACECYAVVTHEYDRLLATGFTARQQVARNEAGNAVGHSHGVAAS